MKNLLQILLLVIIPISFVPLVKAQSEDNILKQATELYIKKDYDSAFPLMLKVAKKNDPQAQINIGLMYENGYGCSVNNYEAVKWYRKAAEQGFHWGEYNLGVMYFNGKGIKRDYSSAIFYFRKAAEQNNEFAIGFLGNMLEKGYGCEKDFDEAIKLYQKAARLSDKWSQDRLTQLGYSW